MKAKIKFSLSYNAIIEDMFLLLRELVLLMITSIEKLYFVLDSESGVIKLFKSPESITARDSYSLYGGTIKKSESILFLILRDCQ